MASPGPQAGPGPPPRPGCGQNAAGLRCAQVLAALDRPAHLAQTLFIDDLDGSEAEDTIRFGLDGTEYEIDLNAEHGQALRDALAR